MSTTSPTVQPSDRDNSALRGEDAAAVLEHFASGQPLDPAIVARIRARAEQVTTDIRREHGLVDDDTFHALLDDEA
jgi:hypothetical protein